MTEEFAELCTNTPICKSFAEASDLYSSIKPAEKKSLKEWFERELTFFGIENGAVLTDGPKRDDLRKKSTIFDTICNIEDCMERIFYNEVCFTRSETLLCLCECNEWIRNINSLYLKTFSLGITMTVWCGEKYEMIQLGLRVALKLERLTTLIYSLVELLEEQKD